MLFFLLLFVHTLSSTLLDTFIGAIENNSAQVLVFDAESQATIAVSRVTSEDFRWSPRTIPTDRAVTHRRLRRPGPHRRRVGATG